MITSYHTIKNPLTICSLGVIYRRCHPYMLIPAITGIPVPVATPESIDSWKLSQALLTVTIAIYLTFVSYTPKH